MKEIEQRMHNKIFLMPILTHSYIQHTKKRYQDKRTRKLEIKMSMKFLDVAKKAVEMSELLNNSFGFA